MMNIIENLHEKESVISELHSKIRTLENDTPKSSPETYGNGEERKNLSEPKRHRNGLNKTVYKIQYILRYKILT